MKNKKQAEHLSPVNEASRVKKLHRYEILDTPPEASFDTVARLAQRLFVAHAGFITFVDADRVFLKSSTINSRYREFTRIESLCSIAIESERPTLILDTRQLESDEYDLEALLEQEIIFYAGAPIITSDGHRIGTVCVTDTKPRNDITAEQLEMLELLSFIVIEKLETRLAGRRTIRAYDDRLHRMVHDMKNPITSISMYAQIMGRKMLAVERVSEISNKIETAAKSVEQHLNNVLNEAKIDNEGIYLVEQPVLFSDLTETLKNTFELSLNNKKQKLHIIQPAGLTLYIDRERIQDVLDNLLSNAIKYSHRDAEIRLIVESSENMATIEFRDQGVGMTEEDLQKVFVRFARLSSVPTAHERSNGLGLSIVKMLVELHGGQVWARSKGPDKGSSFFLTLPMYKAMPFSTP
ncbi:GAF domain-containing sensor histidine kinase [Pedobacter sp. SYP-B3415]|uniref:GAF domain-containing sensor histidine kinase n=1 Tax=Pedobacter sp. SYP-B3415 TaxID=2496641 RepID=UPI00101CF7C2|nr:GAF domain-containing sensor histidine kinase [Pedobacter sp. SYP-B3415]